MLWRSCSLNNRETEKFMKKRKKRALSAFISSFFLTFVIVSCILGGIGLAFMPGAQEYRECRAAALTQTDMYTCDQKFQGTMDKLTGASSSSSSAAR